MPIISAINPNYEDIVTYDVFRNLSDMDKGCYLIRQYIGLYRIHAIAIRPTSFEDIFNLQDCPVLLEFEQMLQSFYSYYETSINKDDSLNKRIMSIIQWLRRDIRIPLDITYTELSYFYNKKISTEVHDPIKQSIDNDPIIVSLFMFGRLTSLLNGRYVSSYQEFLDGFGDIALESMTVEKPILYTPSISYNVEEDGEVSGGFLILNSCYGLNNFTIDYNKIFSRLNYSIFELALSCSEGLSNDIDYIVGVLAMYNIGHIYKTQYIPVIVSSLLRSGNLDFIDIRDNKHFLSYSSINTTIKDIASRYNLVVDENSLVYKTLSEVNFFDGTEEHVNEIKNKESGLEAFSITHNIRHLLDRVSMEDDTDAVPDTETEEDNIDEKDTDGDTDDENFEDQPVEETEEEGSDPFDTDFNSDDSSGDNSSGSSGNTDSSKVQVDKNKNIDTNSKKGLKLELDTNPTFDSVLTKEEIVVLINNYLNSNISNNKKTFLTHIKNKWVGLISVSSIIGWVELVLGHNIFKKN